ncbi:MAG: Na+/galactose cotransporter [Terracidiphilus sp.]|nr:Na+/galactose cotransporter [Terracidiphilus sp.]MDR3776250.1 Na+/galactose cotransporter [Terracidiphilus sp.]
MTLTALDWLILLLSFAFVLGIGWKLKSRIKTGQDFLHAGRSLPAWLCGLAFVGASTGALEVVGMGAAGARFGLAAAHFYWLGAIPAMLFLGVFMMPVYYGSKARSVPEFLGLRFDAKTRLLHAVLYLAVMVASAGVSLYLMARALQGLHLFDVLFRIGGLSPQGILPFSIALLAAVVLAYVLLGGLAGAMYNQVLQFFLLVAGFAPVVYLGLRSVGGWSGLQANVPAAYVHTWQGSGSPLGIEMVGLGLGLGFVLAAASFCMDQRVIQTALAAKDVESARKTPLIAAIPRLLLPFLLVLPGLIAIALPTPHTTTEERIVGGSIFRNTTVVRPEAEAGLGLVPAKVDPASGKPAMKANGQPVLDYDMATPNLLLRFLPTGLLGLGLAALLASFMGGMAACVTAFNTVFTRDIYEATLRKDASDARSLAVGRWAAVGSVLLSVGAALAVFRFNSILDALELVFAVVMAPLVATVLLGMFWKRATGHGAFAGLLAGTVAALLHHGLSLPVEAHVGLHGGWIATLHSYPSDLAQNVWTAIFAFVASLLVTVAVSYATTARPEAELCGLVYQLTPQKANKIWWKRPEALAAAILLVVIALNVLFA